MVELFDEEKRREKRKQELRSKINKLTAEKANLDEELALYMSMNSQINEVMDILANACNCLDESCTSIKKYYDSTPAYTKVSEISEAKLELIMQNNLDVLLESSNGTIAKIKSKISAIEWDISTYRTQLRNL